MAFKRNTVKIDLCSYPPYVFLAPKKFGKTTFWYNLVNEAWGSDDKGLLISFGNEEGYHSLDGIQVEVAKEWNSEYDKETELRGFVQIIDDIIENNSEYGIKGVCFDTLDTMVEVCTKEVLRQHKKEKGSVCKSLNDAFSGYGRGKARLFELMDTQVERLRDAGIAVFYLCHIKNKEKTDLVSGEKYEMITNNLSDDIFSHIADAAQIVMVGTLDREINNGKILNEDRVVYLRGTSTVDAGGRFTEIKDRIELSPRAFLEAFEDAVKASIKKNFSDKDFEKMKNKECEKRDIAAQNALKKELESKANPINEDRNIELIGIIQTKFPNASDEVKAKVKDIMADAGIKNFKNTDVHTKPLEGIVELLA
jgi:hypothetical protein